MNKESKPKAPPPVSGAEEFRKLLSAPAAGQTLSVLFGLLFLFQCMILPLVGKAAVGGSGSPGAGPAATLWKNQAFFAAMLVLTLTVGGAAFYAKWLRRKADGSPYPKFTAGLLALALALLLAFATGLLGI
ncbi:MAG TPA: hypothetical protein PK388_08685 [Kiritimatiellia bacterium]|nr:hypothetical protein [Kiritimatiellia bacterium]